MAAKTALPAAFVDAEVDRLHLDGPFTGLWVEVKRELTFQEEHQITGAMLRTVKGASGDSEIGVDYARGTLEKLATWLVDWNFEGHDGKQVTLNRGSIQNLRTPLAAAIEAAIDRHQEGQAALKAATPSAPS